MRNNVIFSILFVCFLLSFIHGADATSLNIKLTLNNTENKVYIPGVGEVLSNSLGAETYTNPTHYYLVSYLNNVLYGLVFHRENPISISISNTSENHTLTLTQEITNSEIFLVFTKGDWKVINNRISMIEAGNFLNHFSPSFSFGLGSIVAMKILLSYQEFELQPRLILQRGYYKIMAEYTGNSGGKPMINISRA
jgi:hypothetical protein